MNFAARACLSAALVASVAAQPIEFPDATLPYEPPREGRPLRGLTITIDAGHGGSSYAEGYSGSARGVNSGVVEGDLNLLVMGQLVHYLRRGGATVHRTRQDDRRVTWPGTDRATEPGARTALAMEKKSHLFLALHHNSAPRETADGVVVLIWPTDSQGQDQPLERAFAGILREEVEAMVHHSEEFPHYINEHPLVAGTDIPSAVIEFGFLSNPEFDAWVSQQGAHLDEARGVYNAVVRMWQEHGDALKAKHAELFGETEVRAGGDRNEQREDSGRREPSRLARNLWPVSRPPETAEEAQRLLDIFRRAVLKDQTFFLFQVKVEGSPRQGWILTGRVNHPRSKAAAESLLEGIGLERVTNQIRLLPDDRVGDLRHAVVQIPMALSYAEPNNVGTQQTELLLGERVFMLDYNDPADFALVQASDGYIGWVRADALWLMDADEITDWDLDRRLTVTRDFMLNDFRIPTGARLPVRSVGEDEVTARLPLTVDGTDGTDEISLPLEHVRLPEDPNPGRVAAETASNYLTIPYVFGGRSALGLDCSGLVNLAWQTAGVRLPRDARQMVIVGEIVGTPWRIGPFRPGDILFFMSESGDITHTGLSLGGLRFIHESPPQVQIGSLDRTDPLYDDGLRKAFAFARRPME